MKTRLERNVYIKESIMEIVVIIVVIVELVIIYIRIWFCTYMYIYYLMDTNYNT